jgi:small subunit ribosomal protein S11e
LQKALLQTKSLAAEIARQNVSKKPFEVKELILDKCAVAKLAGDEFEGFANLENLSMNGVGLTSLENFPSLQYLRRLELNDNKIGAGLVSVWDPHPLEHGPCTPLAAFLLSHRTPRTSIATRLGSPGTMATISVAAVIDQNKQAFQKQDTIFVGSKRLLQKKIKKDQRYVKNVGLGIKTPKEAYDGMYIDKKCPFTGNVTIRGRLLTGTVKTTKMDRTIIIRRDYLHYIRKYHRYEKRHKTLAAHCSPCFRVNPGDQVLVGQCRPLSKTVRFNVIKIVKKFVGDNKHFSKF